MDSYHYSHGCKSHFLLPIASKRSYSDEEISSRFIYEKLLANTKIQQGKSKIFLNNIALRNPFKDPSFLMLPMLPNNPRQKQWIILKTELAFPTLARKSWERARWLL